MKCRYFSELSDRWIGGLQASSPVADGFSVLRPRIHHLFALSAALHAHAACGTARSHRRTACMKAFRPHRPEA
jgi:hypothetical protein